MSSLIKRYTISIVNGDVVRSDNVTVDVISSALVCDNGRYKYTIPITSVAYLLEDTCYDIAQTTE